MVLSREQALQQGLWVRSEKLRPEQLKVHVESVQDLHCVPQVAWPRAVLQQTDVSAATQTVEQSSRAERIPTQ